ncbi:MAG: amino acid adenylation domain-containing protein [Clostridia bacterium]|nr:amino acid adenylation domain-containing protein [Clostridia bacterium]
MIGNKEVKNQKYILEYFRNLSKQKSIPVSVSCMGNKTDAVMHFTSKRGSEPSVKIDDILFPRLIPGNEINIEISNEEDIYLFRSVVIYSLENNYDIKLPSALSISFRRQVPRYRIGKEDTVLLGIKGKNKNFRVNDISIKGLSFVSDKASYEKDQFIKNAFIKIPHTAGIHVDGTVCHHRIDGNNEHIYGISINNINWSEQLVLFNYVYKNLYPKLRSFNELSVENISSIFKNASSAYIESNEKTGYDYGKFINTFNKLYSKSSISSGLAYIKEDMVYNLGVAMRIYNRTFYGYQLYSLPETKLDPEINNDVYIGLADNMLSNRCFEYYISYITREFKQQRDMFSSISNVISDQAKFCFDAIYNIEYLCEEKEKRADNYGYSCEPCRDISSFIGFCNEALSPLEIGAYGYCEEQLDQSEIKEAFGVFDITMDRNLWRVVKDGIGIAYAVAESYPEGINLDRMHDVCRIYFLEENPEIDKILGTLVVELSEYYESMGKKRFSICFKLGSQVIEKSKVRETGKITTIGRVMANRKGMLEYKKLLAGNMVHIPRYYNLTHPQLAIWFTEKVYPGTNFANITSTVRIKDKIDFKLLNRAINLVVMKNDALRMRFVEIGGEPRQFVSSYEYINSDIFEFDGQYGKEEFSRWTENMNIKHFNIINSDLFYFALFKLDNNEGGFYIKMHHLISDAWSMSASISKIVEYYTKLKKGISVSKLDKPSYIDYISSEERFLDSYRFQMQKQFWKNKFESIPELISLKPAAAVCRETKAERRTFKITKELTSAINSYSRETKSSVFSVFLSVFSIYLNRITSMEDMVLGSPILNRSGSREKEMAGMFVSVVPVRLNVDTDIEFNKFVTGVSREWMLVLKNQKYPFNLIQKDFRERHGISDNLYDIVLSFQNAELDKLEADYDVKWEFNGHQTNSLSIHINDRDNEGQYKVDFDYLADAFSQSEIEYMFYHMMNLLTDAVKNPSKKLHQLQMLSEDEKYKILYEFNRTEADYPKDKTIHEIFEEQAECTPDNIAVVYKDRQLTYRELNEKANQLAWVLRGKGVGPDTIVGIMVERSPEMIVGIIAILKAGGAYLPIDPEYAEDRINYMLKDSNAIMLLTREAYCHIPAFSGETLYFDKYSENNISVGNIEKINKPESIAYVIYTSGSTGKPKGVMVANRSLVNLCCWYRKEFGIEENSKVLMMIPFCFDASVKNILTPLIAGGQLLLAPVGYFNANTVRKLIFEKGVTLINCVPSAIYPVIELAGGDNNYRELKSLRYLLLGGESMSISKIKPWLDSSDCKCILGNIYGPTECTDISAYYLLEKEKDKNIKTVPIGRPIHNSKLYILGKHNQIQPIGVAGELCISGSGISMGYIGKERLTAEKFVQNPFIAGELMYKTGDYAKWLPDGNIEFLGRIDGQVKIRGFRIELGEIESRLLKQKSIKEAVVEAREDEDGKKYLCAYYVSDTTLSVSDLRTFLLQKLPDYMVPAYFIRMDKLPLSANGKIDRKALPEPDKDANSIESYEAPANETEEKLAEVWKGILGLRRVGAGDNFFELGGDSLKAITLISSIYKEFGVEIPISVIFENPVLKELSKQVGNSNIKHFSSIKIAEKSDYYPVSSSQKRMFVLNGSNADSISYNMPGAILIKGRLDSEHLRHVLEKIIERHESFRTSFHLLDGEVVQKVNEKVKLTFKSMKIAGSEISTEVRKFVRPFDLSKAPLFRAELISESEEKNIMLIDMHHIISDGISCSILIKEIADLYAGKNLPELKLQYKDYTVWQKEFLKCEEIKAQEAYWIEKLSGELPVLNMPMDYNRPPIQSFEGDRISFAPDDELTRRLKQLAADTGTTLYIVLLAAYNVLLCRYTGQEDIVIGSPVAGRGHSDLENVVGMFVNTLAMRNYPSYDKTFMDFLSEVRQNAIGAYENQDYQFEELLEKLNVKKDLSKNPLFDTMFTLQNIDVSELRRDNLVFSPYELDCKTSKFDFSIQAVEKAEAINFNLDYCTGLFRHETMERFKNHFLNLLSDIVRRPSCKICELEIMTEEEKNRLLYEFNRTEAEYPKEKTIHELFEEQVERTPDNIAVVYQDRQLTYKELNEKANQLAWVLRGKGVGSDTIVGIMVERSPEMIVGIMAILKAGGAYLPISPSYPEERIEYMLKDSSINIVLTCGNTLSCADFSGTILDLLREESYSAGLGNLDRVNTQKDLAYIIYTSGSTGKPKGVMVCHQSVVNVLFALQEKYPLLESDSFLQKTTYTFDVSVAEIFGWYLGGGRLILLEEGAEKEPRAILKAIDKYDITHLNFVPSMFKAFLYMLKEEDIRIINKLKYIFLAGEAVSSDIVPMFCKLTERVRLENLYGPTEATIYATGYSLNGLECCSNVPIGKPLKNYRAYVLDRYNTLQPVGVAGELCIAGNGLARGYRNNIELTNRKFIPNPYIDGEKIYKTGDLVRWLPNGNIEYIGRIDYQVKIRGFRIELGEIENRLLLHEYVKDAVVVAKEDGNGSKYLCAYYVSDKTIPVQDLRIFLLKELPEYMVPAYFTRMDKLPLSTNGKIDRKALPIPDKESNIIENYEAPANETEEKLAEVWKEILGLSRVGAGDNFFELGGDSLSILKVLASTYQYGWNLEMQDFYKLRTLRDMADKIRGNMDEAAGGCNDKENIDEIADMKLTRVGNECGFASCNLELKNILLTGATGYLGIHILSEIIEKTGANVHCLVRGDNVKCAEEKLERLLSFYFGDKYIHQLGKRIFIVNGDVSLDKIGLSDREYGKLGTKIDLVIHSAALVKHYGDYSVFEKVNVFGTQNVLDFCKEFNCKLCHISTISVSGTTTGQGLGEVNYTENDFYIGQDYSDNVYVKSKFEAEKITFKAIINGLDAVIVRVGNLTGRFSDGKFQINIKENNFYNILKSIMDLGIVSDELLGRHLEFTPVDCCSNAIMRICSSAGSYGKVYHLFNHKYISMEQFRDRVGLLDKQIKVLDRHSFDCYIREVSAKKDTRDYLIGIVNELSYGLGKNTGKNIKIKSENTTAYLHELGFMWPEIDMDYISKVVNYLKSVNFLSN